MCVCLCRLYTRRNLTVTNSDWRGCFQVTETDGSDSPSHSIRPSQGHQLSPVPSGTVWRLDNYYILKPLPCGVRLTSLMLVFFTSHFPCTIFYSNKQGYQKSHKVLVLPSYGQSNSLYHFILFSIPLPSVQVSLHTVSHYSLGLPPDNHCFHISPTGGTTNNFLSTNMQLMVSRHNC